MKTGYLLAGVAGLAFVAGAFYLNREDPAPATSATPGRAMVEVNVPALEGQAKMGALAFEAKCAACHGVNAAGQAGVAPPLIHKIYEPGHHGDMSFLRAVQFGVQSHHWRFGDMPPVEGLTEAEVATIVAYIRTVQRANGIF